MSGGFNPDFSTFCTFTNMITKLCGGLGRLSLIKFHLNRNTASLNFQSKRPDDSTVRQRLRE